MNNNIFQNILILNLYFIKNNNINLINLLRNSLKIETLEIYYKCDNYINSKNNSKIILLNIKNLKIEYNNDIK